MKSLKRVLILIFFLGTFATQAQYYLFVSHTSPTVICYGSTVYAYADISLLPPGNLSLYWYKINGDCGQAPPIMDLYSTSSYISIWETGSYQCVAIDSAGNQYVSMNLVSVLVLPSSTFPGGPTHLRSPQATLSNCGATFVNLCIPDVLGNNVTIQWYKDNVTIPTGTADNYLATSSGYYKYRLTIPCGSAFSDSIYVTVGASMPNQITAAGATTFCTGGSVVLNAPTDPGLIYQWKRSNLIIPGATSSSYTATLYGGHSCTISRPGCIPVNSNSISVIVQPPSNVSFTLASNYNLTSPPVTLNGTPTGGTYTGPGVSGNIFTPSVAGPGTHTITYSYTPTGGCTGTISRTTTVCGPPTTPVSITGNSTPCANSSGVVYSCPSVSGATSYTWTVPAGATIASGQGTNSITVNFGATFTSGIIGVSANTTTCGSSAPQTKSVSGKPAQPGTISGLSNGVCGGSVNVPYSIAAVSGATSYNWSGTSGASIVSGQGTTQVLVNFNSNFSTGTISVTASNACGASNVRSTTVRSKPPTPGPISGPTGFCAFQQGVVYSTAAVAGATTYDWLVPNGATIVSGQGTTSITVNFGNKSGKIKVAAGNNCGLSSYSQLNVFKNCRVGNFENSTKQATIYPNPSSTDFVLKTGITDDSAMQLQIFDVSGKLIFEEIIHGSEYMIHVSLLVPGVYQVLLKTTEQVQRIRVVKNE